MSYKGSFELCFFVGNILIIEHNDFIAHITY